MNQQTLRRATFRADWMDETLPGFTHGHKWNGWAMPLFEFETANKILDSMKPLAYDQKADAFIFTDPDWPDEPDIYAASFIEVEGRTVKVYGIGAGFWCWYEGENA